MNFKTKLAAGAALLALTSFANAATVKSHMQSGGGFLLEDDSGEYLIDVNQNGILDVGDRLRGIIEFPFITYDGNQHALDGVQNQHIGAVFETEITSKTFAGIPGLFNFTFGPSAAFEAEYGMGALAAFYVDDVDNVNIKGADCATYAQVQAGGVCEQTITDGTLAFTAGFTGVDGDEGWTAFGAPENAAAGAGALESTTLGNFNYNLNVLNNPLAFDFNQIMANPFAALGGGVSDGLVDLSGSGSLLGTIDTDGDKVTGYDFTDDADIAGNHVPEPASIALFGLAALGLAGVRRRKS